MTPSPTSLTQRWFSHRKIDSQNVECFLAHAKVRRDLLGIIDIVAPHLAHIYGIQATSWDNVSARCNKALSVLGKASGKSVLKSWIEGGGIFQVWGWRRLKKGDYMQNIAWTRGCELKFVARVRQAMITPNNEVIFREIDPTYV